MKYGEDYRNDAESMRRNGQPLPFQWLPIPSIESRDSWYMCAFTELSTCRQVGMAVGPIPWTAIVSYCDRMKIESEKDFNTVIRSMDSAYLKIVKEMQDA